MKKIFAFVISVVMLLSVCVVSAYAQDEAIIQSETVEYLEDGSYIVTVLTVEEENIISRATSSKTGSKTVTIYNDDDEAMVVMKLTGTFTYNGSTATCTNASTSYTLNSSNWKVTSAVASKSGNVAKGDFVAKRYLLLVPVQTVTASPTITCTASGVLS